MWGRKDEPEAQPVSAPAVNPAAGQAQESQRPAPAAAAARPASADRGARNNAQVGKSIKFKGEISGSEDLVIDGEVEGTIELRDNSLIVGPNGNVRAQIKARTITVQGRLEGNVHAGERIEIRKTGSLEGDLVTPAHCDRGRRGLPGQYRHPSSRGRSNSPRPAASRCPNGPRSSRRRRRFLPLRRPPPRRRTSHSTSSANRVSRLAGVSSLSEVSGRHVA